MVGPWGWTLSKSGLVGLSGRRPSWILVEKWKKFFCIKKICNNLRYKGKNFGCVSDYVSHFGGHFEFYISRKNGKNYFVSKKSAIIWDIQEKYFFAFPTTFHTSAAILDLKMECFTKMSFCIQKICNNLRYSG